MKTEKTCSKCGVSKPINQFGAEKRSADKHRYSCLECDRKRRRTWYDAMTPKQRQDRVAKGREARRKNPERDRLYQEKYRTIHRAKTLIRHAKRRAAVLNVPFNLDTYVKEIQSRIDTGECELTGERFNLKKGRNWNAPSLDRIEPKKGYVYSNIRIVCFVINCALGNWGQDVLIHLVRKMQRKQRG
jgi:hypothetical protein